MAALMTQTTPKSTSAAAPRDTMPAGWPWRGRSPGGDDAHDAASAATAATGAAPAPGTATDGAGGGR